MRNIFFLKSRERACARKKELNILVEVSLFIHFVVPQSAAKWSCHELVSTFLRFDFTLICHINHKCVNLCLSTHFRLFHGCCSCIFFFLADWIRSKIEFHDIWFVPFGRVRVVYTKIGLFSNWKLNFEWKMHIVGTRKHTNAHVKFRNQLNLDCSTICWWKSIEKLVCLRFSIELVRVRSPLAFCRIFYCVFRCQTIQWNVSIFF